MTDRRRDTMKNRLKGLVMLATAGTAALGALTATATAQAPPVVGGPTYTVAIRAQQSHVAGRIAAVDPSRNVVVLDEGTRLVVPEILPLNEAALGAAVRATYEVREGRNVVTAIEVIRVSVAR
jgi:hypothetical protein